MDVINQSNTSKFSLQKDLIHKDAVIAPTATILGDVHLHQDVNVWFQSVIRGDTESIEIQMGTNIQDGCILHADPGYPLIVGQKCTIGHGAVLHGAIIGDGCVIGIRSTILNGVTIGENSMVAAGSLLPPGKIYPASSLIMGNPASVKRKLSDQEISFNKQIAERYILKSKAILPSDSH